MHHVRTSSSWVLLVALCAGASAARADGTLVTLPSGGKLQGLVNDERQMLEWRGIPFAEPPVGPLRWKPPVPTTWTGIRDATEFGAHCTQPGDDGSQEDCLYLNVSAPLASPSEPWPVMVDIHGGANAFGWGREDAGGWVRHDVLVVTFNYRLGALGNFAHPALTDEGNGYSSNYGMRDQIAALEWVRDNISAFGGDPSNVTITGFSSGAGFVIGLEASPKAQGLFVRAAPSSFFIGMVTNQWKTLDVQEEIGAWLGDAFGCPADDPDVLSCLRGLPAGEMVGPWWDNGGGGDAGVVDGEGGILPRPVIELLEENGSVPTLIGHASEEDGDRVYDFGMPDPMSHADFIRWTNDVVYSGIAAKARPYYTAARYGSLFWAYIYFLEDVDVTCPTRRIALATGSPTYKYLSTHVLANDDDAPRARHGSDITLLYDDTWYTQTAEETALSIQMSSYFTNFAKGGNPNGVDLNGDALPTWTPFVAGTEDYMEFGGVATPRTGGYQVTECNVFGDTPIFPKCGVLCRWFTHWFDLGRQPTAQLTKVFRVFRQTMCQDEETIEVAYHSVDRHLAEGAVFGACIVPVTLPGRIEAENYAYGGEGEGYHDLSPGSFGGYYRFDDVDVRLTGTRDGYQVGWTDPGEWLAYDVVVSQTGLYQVTARLASGCCYGPKTFHLELDGVPVGPPISFELIDDWNTLHDIVGTDIPLTAGPHRLRFVWNDGPFDLDSFELSLQ